MAKKTSPGPKTHAKFDYADSDVILRSSDGVLFRVHKMKLAVHSTVFHDMFECGTASEDERTAGIPVSETAATLAVLLSLCYPAANDDAPAALEALSLALQVRVYEASCKYNMWVASRLMRHIILPRVRGAPFSMARAGFVTRDRELAQLAAKATLQFDLLAKDKYRVKAGPAWTPLLEYHMRCRREMQRFMTYTLSFIRPWDILRQYGMEKHMRGTGGCGRSADSQERRREIEQEWDRFCLTIADRGPAQLPKARVLLEMDTHRDDSYVRECDICRDHWNAWKALVEKFAFSSVFEL